MANWLQSHIAEHQEDVYANDATWRSLKSMLMPSISRPPFAPKGKLVVVVGDLVREHDGGTGRSTAHTPVTMRFTLMPLAAERVEVTAECLHEIERPYFAALLEEIAARWPETGVKRGVHPAWIVTGVLALLVIILTAVLGRRAAPFAWQIWQAVARIADRGVWFIGWLANVADKIMGLIALLAGVAAIVAGILKRRRLWQIARDFWRQMTRR